MTRLILSFNLANTLLLLVFLIEGLWVYLLTVWLAKSDAIGWTGVPLSLPSILIVLAASYFGAANLGQQHWSDRKARLVTVIYLTVVLVATARFENGGGYRLLDPGWFVHAGDQLANTFFSPFQATLVGGVYLWRRGYKLAESRIDFDQVFSSFVVGLVAVILGFVLGELALRSSDDPVTGRGLEMLITVSFFFVALSALALSHAREMRGSMATPEDQSAELSTPWSAVLFGVVTAMVVVGWLVALLFSFDVLNPVLHVTFFVLDALLFVVYYVVIVPIGYVVVGLLSPNPPMRSGLGVGTRGEGRGTRRSALDSDKWGRWRPLVGVGGADGGPGQRRWGGVGGTACKGRQSRTGPVRLCGVVE